MDKKNLYITHKRDLDLYPLEIEILEAQKADAESKLQQAKINLERCTIRTPFKGRMQTSDFEDGQYVSEGTKICTIVEEHCIDIPVAVNALDAMNLGLKMDGGGGYGHWFTGLEKLEVEACWVERPDVRWKGIARRVSRFDADTRTAVILARIEGAEAATDNEFPLVSGMFCKVTFYGRTVEKIFEIPRSALQFDGKVAIVGEDGRLREIRPKILHRNENSLFISEGIVDGDLVAAFRLQQGIVDGMKVKPSEVDLKKLTGE
jgi:multidrug efflux pump subunit AcrA (membrane-fusion protein)